LIEKYPVPPPGITGNVAGATGCAGNVAGTTCVTGNVPGLTTGTSPVETMAEDTAAVATSSITITKMVLKRIFSNSSWYKKQCREKLFLIAGNLFGCPDS
jgi:hypothetical protein